MTITNYNILSVNISQILVNVLIIASYPLHSGSWHIYYDHQLVIVRFAVPLENNITKITYFFLQVRVHIIKS